MYTVVVFVYIIPNCNDVGTTHPKRIRFMMEDKSIISLWYGTQGFITVSDRNNQFNMQNSELEHYLNRLLENL